MPKAPDEKKLAGPAPSSPDSSIREEETVKPWRALTEPEKKDRSQAFFALGLLSQMGLAMVLPVLGGVWLGNWAAQRFARPSALWVGIGLGIAGAFAALFKLAGKPKNRR